MKISEESADIGVLKLIAIFYNRKKIIGLVTILFSIISVLISISLQKKYESLSIWVSSGEERVQNLGGLAALAGISVGEASEEDFYSDILLSDDMLYALRAEEFLLIDDSKIKIESYIIKNEVLLESESKVMQILRSYVENNIHFVKGRVLSLRVQTKDPVFSKKLNEFLVNKLVKLSGEIKSKKSIDQRRFLEFQNQVYQDSMKRAENRLKAFLLKNRFSETPELSVLKNRLNRDLDLYSRISSEMRNHLEMAKIEEEKAKEFIVFLQKPSVNYNPVAPKKKLIVIVSSLLGIIISLIVCLLDEWWKVRGRDDFNIVFKKVNP
jgi:uncharacterized protein involved in exopolysaccharide biosynthesis